MVAANCNREGTHGGRTATMLFFGPIMGLVYAIALPFIGIVTIASMLAGKAAKGVERLFGGAVRFGWKPDEAYLAGKKKEEKRKKE